MQIKYPSFVYIYSKNIQKLLAMYILSFNTKKLKISISRKIILLSKSSDDKNYIHIFWSCFIRHPAAWHSTYSWNKLSVFRTFIDSIDNHKFHVRDLNILIQKPFKQRHWVSCFIICFKTMLSYFLQCKIYIKEILQ